MEAEDENDVLENFENDLRNLRRSMFISRHQREDNIMLTRFKRLYNVNQRTAARQQSQCNQYLSVLHKDTFPTESIPVLGSADVLEHITVHLSVPDLMSCRQVCKFWSLQMAYILSKRKSLVLTRDLSLEAKTLLKKRSEGQPISLSKLGLFEVTPNSQVYKKILGVFGRTLSTLNLEGCKLSPRDLKQLLMVDAPYIEKFSLREDYLISGGEPPNTNTFAEMKLLNNGSLDLPKLKMLHWDEHSSQTELKDIVEACPNLVSLELRNFPSPRSIAYKNLRWSSLRSMFLSPQSTLETEHCRALANLKLNLEALTLFGLNANDEQAMKSLAKFLATLSGTLVNLEMWLDYGSLLSYRENASYSPLTVQLPKLTKLRTEDIILGHISHVRKLPKIQELEIVSNHHTVEQQNWTALTSRAATNKSFCDHLRAFRCEEIDSKSLEKFVMNFPSITTLSIYATNVDDKLLRSVFKNLPLLQEFTILRCVRTNGLKISDSGITGIPAAQCAKLRQKISSGLGWKDLEEKEVAKKWQSQQPHIGHLKCLRSLNMGFSLSKKVTDVSVFFGITKLPQLRYLKMPMCEITDASLPVLTRRIRNLCSLGVVGCSSITTKGITRLRELRPCMLLETKMSEV